MDTRQPSRILPLAAWAILLLCSALPKIILQELFNQKVSPGLQAILTLSIVFLALAATWIWPRLSSLRKFIILLGVLAGSQWLVYNVVDRLPFYRSRLSSPFFQVYSLPEQSLNLLVTLSIIAALLLMGKKPAEFFLKLGDTAAPAQPVRWLGISQGEPWSRLGLSLTFFISLGTLAFLVIAGRPSLDIVVRVLPFLPVILLAAALNALTEEITYKASLLSVLESPVGPRQSLLMVAAYFGIAHFYGIPYGVVGVLLAGFMGWILAKSMLETRGLFWAWFIHFWQDVWIFAFMALGSIVPGGG